MLSTEYEAGFHAGYMAGHEAAAEEFEAAAHDQIAYLVRSIRTYRPPSVVRDALHRELLRQREEAAAEVLASESADKCCDEDR